jgi:hypothetical protein
MPVAGCKYGGEGGDKVRAKWKGPIDPDAMPRMPGVRTFARFTLIRAAACADGSKKLLRKKKNEGSETRAAALHFDLSKPGVKH